MRPVLLRANQSPVKNPAPPSLNTSSVVAAAHVKPVYLHANQSPARAPRQLYPSLGLNSLPSAMPSAVHADIKPVSLRPNFAPVKSPSRSRLGAAGAGGITGGAVVADVPAAEVKPGSGVSKSIFEKDFAEPAGGAGATFSYEELKKPIDQLPGGVDPRRREQYLSDADFERILGMARDKFDALKKWRQNEIKRKAALF